jgi:hypothetical protein
MPLPDKPVSSFKSITKIIVGEEAGTDEYNKKYIFARSKKYKKDYYGKFVKTVIGANVFVEQARLEGLSWRAAYARGDPELFETGYGNFLLGVDAETRGDLRFYDPEEEKRSSSHRGGTRRRRRMSRRR